MKFGPPFQFSLDLKALFCCSKLHDWWQNIESKIHGAQMFEMAKQNEGDSNPEETSANSTSEEAGTPINGRNNRSASEYEKQRLSRIAENRKRMEALGLAKMASAVMGSRQNVGKIKYKDKAKVGLKVEDEDYQPDEGEERMDSSSEEDHSRDCNDDFASGKDSGSRRKKVKKKGVSTKKKASVRKSLTRSDFIDDDDDDDDDDALQQAIALSLQDSAEMSDAKMLDSSFVNEKNNPRTREDEGKKRKKQFISRMKMTEDEVVVNFYQFDYDWKGGIAVKDLRRMAAAHDFNWTDRELSDMVYCFDADGDEKLSLEDFRKIVHRCNMIKEPDTG